MDNPYYKEPAPEKKPAAGRPQSPSGTQTNRLRKKKPSGSNVATPSGGGNSSVQITVPASRKILAIPKAFIRKAPERYAMHQWYGWENSLHHHWLTRAIPYLVIDGKRKINNCLLLKRRHRVRPDGAFAVWSNGSMSMIPQEELQLHRKCEAEKSILGCPVCKMT